jgi:serine/threonine protein kinase
MNALDQIGALLVELEVVRESQWQAACLQAGTTRRLEPVLDALGEQPAWWADAESFTSALSSYQRQQILRKADREGTTSLRAGLRLNEFLVLDILGRGGMAVVFKCWDLDLRRFVALKRIKKDLAILRKRFQREIEVMGRLNHPSIASFLGSGTAHGTALLVMEYLQGPTLRAEVEARNPVPWREVVGWFLPLLDALEHAHKHGVVHRDIKPGNVMLHREGKRPVVPKLLDMGLARCLEGAAALRGGGTEETMSRTGQIIGTIDYMPPEQWAGADRVVPESDLYALGGTMYYALTGKPPFGKGTPGRVALLLMAHNNSPAPSVRAVRPDVPDMLDLLIQQMMSKLPSRRGSPSLLRPQLLQLHRMAPTNTIPVVPPPGAGHAAASPVPAASGSRPVARIPGTDSPASPATAKATPAQAPAPITANPSRQTSAPVPSAPPARAVTMPRSVIASDSTSDLGRLALALVLGTVEWLISLSRPWRHPLRFLLAAAVLAGLLKYCGVW